MMLRNRGMGTSVAGSKCSRVRAMEANCTKMTERILQLTLEIIYLLTGEDNIVVKKTSGDGQNSVMVPLHSLRFPERKNERNILEVTKKMIELLTGEIGNGSSFNISVKEEIKAEEEESVMEEWEYLEGHKELYKDVMMASQPALTSPDGSSNGNPPERCPRPLYSRVSTQDDLAIPHHHQSGNLGSYNIVIKEEFVNEDEAYGLMKEGPERYENVTMGPPIKRKPPERCPRPPNSRDPTREGLAIPHHHQGEEFKYVRVVVKEEEEETLVGGDQPSMEEGEMAVTTKTEESSLPIDEYYSREDNGVALYAPGESIVAQNPFEDYETSFLQNHDLVAHQRSHTSDKPFSCYMCRKSFITRSELVQHYKTHAKIKPFSCFECGKSFHEKSKLLRHHRVHTGEKPYPCSVCGKCFSDKGNCDKHMRVHTGEKPFACPDCDKCFAQKVALIIHQGTHIAQDH